MKCAYCDGSKTSSYGRCLGTSTGVPNCMRTTYSTDRKDSVCKKCRPNYWLDMDSNKCTFGPKVENCHSGYTTNKKDYCHSCKNGYTLKSTLQIVNGLHYEVNTCEKSTMVENCTGVFLGNKCRYCHPTYYVTAEGKCARRLTMEQRMCYSGKKVGMENGKIVCESCNTELGFYAIEAPLKMNIGNVCKAFPVSSTPDANLWKLI